MSRNDRGNQRTEMADSFDACLTFTLREEGGYVDDPADPGGATDMGITLATYREWSDNPELGPAQVEDMTDRTARAIYRSLYWNPLRADALTIGVDLSVFNMGVNAGIWRSARLLQRALGFTGEDVDGSVAARPWTRQRNAIRAYSSPTWPNDRRHITGRWRISRLLARPGSTVIRRGAMQPLR